MDLDHVPFGIAEPDCPAVRHVFDLAQLHAPFEQLPSGPVDLHKLLLPPEGAGDRRCALVGAAGADPPSAGVQPVAGRPLMAAGTDRTGMDEPPEGCYRPIAALISQ